MIQQASIEGKRCYLRSVGIVDPDCKLPVVWVKEFKGSIIVLTGTHAAAWMEAEHSTFSIE